MANRFYEIQIGDIYLTDDGTISGTPCKLEIPNLEDLLTPVVGAVVYAASGKPVIQSVPWSKGKPFEIQIEVLTKAVWDDLKTLINTAQSADTSFSVIGTGDTGNFSLSAKPFPSKPFSAKKFLNSRIYGISLRFITV